MLFLRLLIISGLFIVATSCSSGKHSKALVKHTAVTKVAVEKPNSPVKKSSFSAKKANSPVKKSSFLAKKNNSPIKKVDVSKPNAEKKVVDLIRSSKKLAICDTEKFQNININNFVFTPEVDQCLTESNEFYKYFLFLHKHNVRTANKRLQNFMDNYTQKSLSLDSIVAISNKRVLVWLDRKSKILKPDIEKPIFDTALFDKKIDLVQQEFETTQAFQRRIANTKNKIQQSVERAKQAYTLALSDYNQQQSTYNNKLEQEKRDRKNQARGIYLDFLSAEVKNILGDPYLQEDLFYDADKEVFYTTLLATNSDWSEEISIQVPVAVAKNFKQNIAELIPVLSFDINEQGELFILDLMVRFKSEDYQGKTEKRPKKTLLTESIQIDVDSITP